MREPVFTETLQIALVVRDLETTMRTYVDEYGIGPWQIYEFNPDTVAEMVKDGRPAEYAFRLAVTMVGSVQWELIQPLDDRSMYADFLATKGEGLHTSRWAYQTTARRLTRCVPRGAACSRAASTTASPSPTCRPTTISASSRRSSTGRRDWSRGRTRSTREQAALRPRGRPPLKVEWLSVLRGTS